MINVPDVIVFITLTVSLQLVTKEESKRAEVTLVMSLTGLDCIPQGNIEANDYS